MKKLFIFISLIMLPFFGNSQSDTSIFMNDPLIEEYFTEFIQEANDRDKKWVKDKLLSEIKYIFIIPENQDNVKELAEFDSSRKFIKLSSKVKHERLMLKINLYRELSHILGVPYDDKKGSVIMYREKKHGFSYAAFDDIDIMHVEMNRIFGKMKNPN